VVEVGVMIMKMIMLHADDDVDDDDKRSTNFVSKETKPQNYFLCRK